MWEVVVVDVAAAVVIVVVVFVAGVAKSEIHFIYDRKQAASNRESTWNARMQSKRAWREREGVAQHTERKREKERECNRVREGQAREGKRELSEGGVRWQNRLRRQVWKSFNWNAMQKRERASVGQSEKESWGRIKADGGLAARDTRAKLRRKRAKTNESCKMPLTMSEWQTSVPRPLAPCLLYSPSIYLPPLCTLPFRFFPCSLLTISLPAQVFYEWRQYLLPFVVASVVAPAGALCCCCCCCTWGKLCWLCLAF